MNQTKFAIIGGDLRMIKLAKLLAKEKKIVYTYGLEKAEELKNRENIKECFELETAIQEAEVIIGPIPFTINGENVNTVFSEKQIKILELLRNIPNKTLITGSVQQNIYEIALKYQVKVIDMMEQEELAIRNAIATAEGAIEIAMKHTEKIIHGSNVLILGFGRIGKVLAKKLEGLSAHVTCAARKLEDKAWIEAYGYQETDSNQLGENLSQYDIIINTVPHLILSSEKLGYVRQESLLIDLASKPGGIDGENANKRGLKFVWGLALPGKVAPSTTAEIIRDTIEHILKK